MFMKSFLWVSTAGCATEWDPLERSGLFCSSVSADNHQNRHVMDLTREYPPAVCNTWWKHQSKVYILHWRTRAEERRGCLLNTGHILHDDWSRSCFLPLCLLFFMCSNMYFSWPGPQYILILSFYPQRNNMLIAEGPIRSLFVCRLEMVSFLCFFLLGHFWLFVIKYNIIFFLNVSFSFVRSLSRSFLDNFSTQHSLWPQKCMI